MALRGPCRPKPVVRWGPIRFRGRPAAGRRSSGSGEVVGDGEVPQEPVADEAVVDDLLEHHVGVGLADLRGGGQAEIAPQRGEVAGERVASSEPMGAVTSWPKLAERRVRSK
jgi:hypothetical protein